MLPLSSRRSSTLSMSNFAYLASATPSATFSKSQKSAMLVMSAGAAIIAPVMSSRRNQRRRVQHCTRRRHACRRTSASGLRLDVQLMALAPAAHHRDLRYRARDQQFRHVDRALDERPRAVVQLFAFLDVARVVFHVFRAPAARVRDVRKLRELAADLGEEAEHLPGDRLHVVLT